jgi:hypothetical protein
MNPSGRWLPLLLLSTVIAGCASSRSSVGCFTPEQTRQVLVALANHHWQNVTQATLMAVKVPAVRSWPPSLEEPSKATAREQEERCEGDFTVASDQRIIDLFAECFMNLTFEFFRNGSADSSCSNRLISLDVRYSACGTRGGEEILAEWVAAVEKGLPNDVEASKPLSFKSGSNSLGGTELFWNNTRMQYTLTTEITRRKGHGAFLELHLTQAVLLPPPHHE